MTLFGGTTKSTPDEETRCMLAGDSYRVTTFAPRDETNALTVGLTFLYSPISEVEMSNLLTTEFLSPVFSTFRSNS